MKTYVSRLVAGCALVVMAVLSSGVNAAGEDAIAAAKAAVSEAQAAAKAAMDAVSDATADAGGAALEAATAAAQAAKNAAEAAQAALSAASEAAASSVSGEQAPAPVSVATAAGDSPYAEHIQCDGDDCQIDLYLTRGFRAFSQCQVCHGLDANGSSFAPSLVDKLKEIDKARYVEVVTDGYTGQVGVMPAWKTNPNVMKYIDQLYAYLKARSDGKLPAGKLKRYDR